VRAWIQFFSHGSNSNPTRSKSGAGAGFICHPQVNPSSELQSLNEAQQREAAQPTWRGPTKLPEVFRHKSSRCLDSLRTENPTPNLYSMQRCSHSPLSLVVATPPLQLLLPTHPAAAAAPDPTISSSPRPPFLVVSTQRLPSPSQLDTTVSGGSSFFIFCCIVHVGKNR
jgi:hypothetical protein